MHNVDWNFVHREELVGSCRTRRDTLYGVFLSNRCMNPFNSEPAEIVYNVYSVHSRACGDSNKGRGYGIVMSSASFRDVVELLTDSGASWDKIRTMGEPERLDEFREEKKKIVNLVKQKGQPKPHIWGPSDRF